MIKLNLLPQYVIEFRRIKVLVVCFVVILALEGGVVIKAYLDLKQQAAWFTGDKEYFDNRKDMISKVVTEASTWKDNSTKYDTYNTFFPRAGVNAYNSAIVLTMQEAASGIGGARQAYFTDMVIHDGTKVDYRGKIKGLMNFLEFYFHMEDQSFTVTPGANPARPAASPAARDCTLNDSIDLIVSGSVKDGLPTAPKLDGTSSWEALYQPYGEGGAAAPAAASNAPPAKGPGGSGGPRGPGGPGGPGGRARPTRVTGRQQQACTERGEEQSCDDLK